MQFVALVAPPIMQLGHLRAFVYNIESTARHCQVALQKICCTYWQQNKAKVSSKHSEVFWMDVLPPLTLRKVLGYFPCSAEIWHPRSQGLEGRVDVYRDATHIMVCLCTFVSVCIWNNGSDYLFSFFSFRFVYECCFIHRIYWEHVFFLWITCWVGVWFGLIFQIWFLFWISVLL